MLSHSSKIQRKNNRDQYQQDYQAFQEKQKGKQQKQTGSASLSISDPSDSAEQEADLISGQVMRNEKTAPITGGQEGTAIQTRQEGDTPAVTAGFENNLMATKGSGEVLDTATRSEMESRMGVDFGAVKLHTGNAADQLSRQVNAKAFTHEQDIYFNSANSPSNKELLAHELVHTAQQQQHAGLSRKIQRQNDLPKTYGTGLLFPGEVNDVSSYSSYWWGYLSQRMSVQLGEKTKERFKDADELDSVMYAAWENRPDAGIKTNNPLNSLYNFYIIDKDAFSDQEQGLRTVNEQKAEQDNLAFKGLDAVNKMMAVKVNKTGKVVWYNFKYEIGKTDSFEMDGKHRTDINKPSLSIQFVSEDTDVKTLSITDTFAPVTGADNNDTDIIQQMSDAMKGTNKPGYIQSPFIASFPMPMNKKKTKELPNKIDFNKQNTFFEYDPDGKLIKKAIMSDVYQFYQEKKKNPQAEKDPQYAETYLYEFGKIYQSGNAKVAVDSKLLEDAHKGNVPETGPHSSRNNKFVFNRIEVKYINKDVPFDASGMPGEEKDQVDAMIEAMQQLEDTRLNILFENDVPANEKPQAKAFIWNILYPQNNLDIPGESGGLSFRTETPMEREIDQVIAIADPLNPGKTEDVLYTFTIEHSDVNPERKNDPQVPMFIFDVYIERIGKVGEKGTVTENIHALDIRNAYGYPSNPTPDSLKKWLKLKYPELLKSAKVKLDYTSVDTLVKTANEGLKACITDASEADAIAFLQNNYKIVIHNSLAAASPTLLSTEQGYNTGPKAHYEKESMLETDEPADGQKILEVQDETADIVPWSKNELLLFELSLQLMDYNLINSSLAGTQFFRQKMCLLKGHFNSVAGLTKGKVVGYYDSAFADHSKNSFMGGKERVFDYSQGTILHEIGHVTANAAVSFAINGRTGKTAQDAFNSFLTEIGKEQKVPKGDPIPGVTYGAPTNYGKKGTHEYYAEAYMLYMLDPEFLISSRPEIYWWFNFLQTKGKAPATTEIMPIINKKRTDNVLKKR